MLKNYITIALRNILKHKVFSFINIFGLATAMCVCMAIIMLVADQMMNDRHNPNRERIYRVNSMPYYKGDMNLKGNETATTTLPLHDELINNYTGIDKVVRIVRGFGNSWIQLEPGHDVNIPLSGFFADPEVLDMFDHQLLYGDRNTALVAPYSVVLTKKAAEKLFEIENPVGESIKMGELGTYKVTGVIKETENKSHIVAEAYASISTVRSLEAAKIREKELDNWYNYTAGWVYVMLSKDHTKKDVDAYLASIQQAHFSQLPTPETRAITYRLQSLTDISPSALINNPIGPFMPWVFIYFMSALAGVVLITSCFNFTNLSIARSMTRAREIGVRKVTGALRRQIFVQFISESIIITLFALALAIVLLFALEPFMLELAFTQTMQWSFTTNYFVFALFIVIAVVVGIMAGLFPAVVLSGFQPIKVLKNLNNTKLMSKMGMRKTLLVAQFSISLMFILTVIVLYNQLNLFLNSDYGFDPSNKIVIQKGGDTSDVLKAELLKQSNISSVSLSSHIPNAGVIYGNGFKKSLEEEEWTDLRYYAVDEDYLKNMNIPLVAGKFFNAQAGASNKNTIVINEQAVGAFHFGSASEAIGQVIIFSRDSTEKEIIGVVRDYSHEMASEKLEPMALMYNPNEFAILQIAYTGSFSNASETVEKVWAKINPGMKVDVKDFSKAMGELYEILFGTLVKVLGFVAVLSIVISCLGLLGMATYTIQTRKKEIALRKVLGISNGSLVYILSKGYLSILVISVLVSVPLAYYMNMLWLEQFAFHVTVDAITISLGILILMILGAFTIGSQTIQAIVVNPVDNLKNE
ncbi:MAG TPA: ABC transporter permease [Fulvivirga sp.]|nr:ABC transporter permease [Fulvivirga sp.]